MESWGQGWSPGVRGGVQSGPSGQGGVQRGPEGQGWSPGVRCGVLGSWVESKGIMGGLGVESRGVRGRV